MAFAKLSNYARQIDFPRRRKVFHSVEHNAEIFSEPLLIFNTEIQTNTNFYFLAKNLPLKQYYYTKA